jgi:tetratricopeptide (TPR) repeat protein
VELFAGEPAQAEEILTPSVEALRSGDDAGWLATNAAWLAEAQYRQGRNQEALRSTELALRVSPPGYLSSLAPAWRTHAKALARAGRHEEARSFAARAADSLQATDAIDDRGEAAAAAAEVFALSGDHVAASEAAAEAVAFFEQKGNVVSAERVRSDELEWGKPA